MPEWDGEVKIWNVDERREITLLARRNPSPVPFARFSPDELVAYVASAGNNIDFFAAASGSHLGTSTSTENLVFSPESQFCIQEARRAQQSFSNRALRRIAYQSSRCAIAARAASRQSRSATTAGQSRRAGPEVRSWRFACGTPLRVNR